MTILPIAMLACPVCSAPLAVRSTRQIACTGCGRLYPVRDGIPVLIESEAEAPQNAE